MKRTVRVLLRSDASDEQAPGVRGVYRLLLGEHRRTELLGMGDYKNKKNQRS